MGIIYIYSIHRPVNKIYFIVMNADDFVIYADTLVCAFPSSPYTDHIVLYRISIQTRMRRPLLIAAAHQGLGEVPTSILKTGPRPGFKNRILVPGCTACCYCVKSQTVPYTNTHTTIRIFGKNFALPEL